jgi:hypothetical protein
VRLDVRSILKAAALGLIIAVLSSFFFRLVTIPRLEAIFNVVLGGVIGFLFGRISIRHGGSDGFSETAVGGCLAAILPVALAWMASMGIGAPGTGVLDFTLNPTGVFLGLVYGTLTGAVSGVVGGLIYASRF